MSNATPSVEDRSPEKAPRANRTSPKMMQQMDASVRNRNSAEEAFTYLHRLLLPKVIFELGGGGGGG